MGTWVFDRSCGSARSRASPRRSAAAAGSSWSRSSSRPSSTIPQIAADLAAGYTRVGQVNLVLVVLPIVILLAMWRWPTRFDLLLGVMFALITAGQLAETALFGGLFGSGLVVIFGLAIALAALLASGLRAALLWFGAFIASVVFAVVTPTAWQRYTQPDPAGDAAFNLVATAMVVLAIVGLLRRAAGPVPAAIRRPAAQHPAARDRGEVEGVARDDRG